MKKQLTQAIGKQAKERGDKSNKRIKHKKEKEKKKHNTHDLKAHVVISIQQPLNTETESHSCKRNVPTYN